MAEALQGYRGWSRVLTRLQSDQLLDRALTTMGMDKVKRKLVFSGVRIGSLKK